MEPRKYTSPLSAMTRAMPTYKIPMPIVKGMITYQAMPAVCSHPMMNNNPARPPMPAVR